jgi:nicotinamide riboside kinase
LISKSFKVGITGPESCGKTTLALQLSNYFNAFYIPEYARLYLENIGLNYTYNDVEHIAKHQLDSIFSAKSSLVICDTESLVLKIWFEEKFNHCPTFITDSLLNSICDIYILCSPDIPWENDMLRENPNDRLYLFELYKKYLDLFNLNYIIVNGSKSNRFEDSINFISNNIP